MNLIREIKIEKLKRDLISLAAIQRTLKIEETEDEVRFKGLVKIKK